MTEKNKASVRQMRYDKDHTFRLPLKFNIEKDSDIKSWLETVKESKASSVQGYIKRLIRTDIANLKNSGMTAEEYLKQAQMEFEKDK